MPGDEQGEGSMKKADSIEHDSPYYVHPSDYPRQMHVNEPLSDSNYIDWSQEMTNFLLAKNKIGFVNGSIRRPESTTDAKYMPWMRCDAMVKGWLHTAMEKEIRNSVKYADTAEEVWSDLNERFAKENAPRGYELKQLLILARQDGSSVSTYYTKLRVLWDELQSVLPTPKCTCSGCTCGIGKKMSDLKEKEKLYEFLLGLDNDFSTIKTQILAMNPIPSLGTAYHLVSEDEQQRQISAGRRGNTDTIALQVSAGMRRDQRTGKSSQKYPKKTNNETTEYCTKCEKEGHNISGCFKVIGYPEWWPGKKAEKTKTRGAAHVDSSSHGITGLSDEQYQQLANMFTGKASTDKSPSANMVHTPTVNTTGNTSFADKWVVDSGATDHITHRDSILKNQIDSMHELPVTIPNGEGVTVKGRGDYTLPNGTRISNVLHVPDFNCNLLSVSRLSRELKCSVTFFPDFFIMQDLHSRTLIGSGRCEDGLYEMEMAKDRRQAMTVSMDTWHKRLGHASNSKLNHISFLKDLLKNKSSFCDSCIKAKHTRLPFPTSVTKTTDCFELIHCDIWGPYRTISTTRASYFLTIVDDHSRAVWVFLLKHKSEASNCLTNFYEFVKTQFNKTIKRVRSDNGGEFTSHNMIDFYNKKGIALETTCPHTPQQNGVVERKHRHLLETARALRFEANLPTKFWGECVLTATYIINRLPSDVIGNKTPYEILYGERPEYNSLKVFGCLVYFWNTETKGDKFKERGRPGVFLGYPRGTKGYKIYDLKDHKTVISRDAKFIENVFPFAKIENAQKEEEIFPFPHSWDETNVQKPNVRPIDEEVTGENGINGSFEPQNENEEDPNDVVTPDPHVETHENEREARQQRNRAPPSRLSDFHVTLPPSIDHRKSDTNQGSSTVHPISNFISYDKFSNAHKAFLSAIATNDEPKSFTQAVKIAEWREAMTKEIQALEENGTWTLEELPDGKRTVDSKWVYKIKYKPTGEIERYKARLVAKGFTQTEGVDYHETFAPVAKLVTVRTLLAVAVKRDWIIHQLDVNNAFLHGDLNEEVYMKIPQGFSKDGETRVCKLHKSLYGLKQASRNWYQKFTTALNEIGFKQGKSDHSLFIYKNGDTHVTALIYVDDVIIAGNNQEKIDQVKSYLDQRFSIKDLGVLKYFLGIEVARTNEGLVLSQRKYTLDILDDCGLRGSRPSAFPMEQSLKLDKDEGGPQIDSGQYRRLIGRLLYLQATRPDISYSVSVLSQFVANPRQIHLDAAHRVVRYLKGTPGQGILLAKDGGNELIAYCDSDWLGCPFTRRSRTGYLLLFGGSPISWKSKKQSVVSRSSAEAEYRAMASTVSEVLWVRWLLSELEETQNVPTNLFCDNQAARHIANNPVFHERTKHVEMDCYFVRERVESKEIRPSDINTKSQIADLLTKPLGGQQLREFLDKLGIRNLHIPA